MIRFDKEDLNTDKKAVQVTELDVRFQDIDAAGIVFFARFFDYVHACYEEFLSHCGHPLPDVLMAKKWAAPLRHSEADYLAPLRFGDKIRVGLIAAHADASEISLGWRIEKLTPQQCTICARAQTVHTFVSLPKFERCAVPVKIVEKLQPILVLPPSIRPR